MSWVYPHGDEAMALFTRCFDAWHLPIVDGQSILEIGACETDWLERMAECYPHCELTGIDARDRGPSRDARVQFVRASAWDFSRPFLDEEPGGGAFDWVVLLGALEHFGLGFYGDPVDEDGDTKTIANIAEHLLKPGGNLYYDVPYNPTHSITSNRHFRIYDDEWLTERLDHPLLTEQRRDWSQNAPKIALLGEAPTLTLKPYHLVARWLTKAA